MHVFHVHAKGSQLARIEDYELFRIIKERENISNDELKKAIEIATRNQDGRFKSSEDFIKVREIMLANQTE